MRIRMLYSLVGLTLCEKMKFMAFTVCLFWTFLLRDSIYVFVHETSEFSGPLLKFFLYVSVLMFMQSFSKIQCSHCVLHTIAAMPSTWQPCKANRSFNSRPHGKNDSDVQPVLVQSTNNTMNLLPVDVGTQCSLPVYNILKVPIIRNRWIYG